jgi:antibiotic biosynthesis monooxygenase (ABM) superfamily enzyme
VFVNVFTYRAKPGREADVVALLEEWDRERRPHIKGFLSAEVLVDVKDARSFVNIARFNDEQAARAVADHPDQDAWYRRLVAVCEAEPVFTDCREAWQSR